MSEHIGLRGCKYIEGDPRDIHTHGLAIFCGRPVAKEDGSWCQTHAAVVFLPPEYLAQSRKAA